SQKGLNHGWIKGYKISYGKGENGFDPDFARVNQDISIYPIENITKAVGEISSEDKIYEELSNVNIGDKSVVYKVTEKVEYLGDTVSYSIEFSKKDVYMSVEIRGNALDLELLKDF
ncbi:MAG: hypothetical protein IIC74_02640, partial [Bacteroidetes bacterium]|nr:hypothetical protein [Bacteroidota bacterium]